MATTRRIKTGMYCANWETCVFSMDETLQWRAKKSMRKVFWLKAESCRLRPSLNDRPPSRLLRGKRISRKSVYTVENQQPKCLHKSLHFLKSVYTVGSQ